MNGGDPLPDSCGELIEAYCDGVISDEEFRLLEAYLLEHESARRAFVAAFHLHTDLHFTMRARRATDAALQRVRASVPSDEPIASRSWLHEHKLMRKPRLVMTTLAASLILAAVFASMFAIRQRSSIEAPVSAKSSNERRDGNVAWLVNAQDCQWAAIESEMPGRDMRAGKLLRLRGGLAQIEFARGARVILQGPAELVLVSGSEARLVHGTLTAHVPTTARGFTILSPRGKVVDLGTEFGLSVDDEGDTTVRVFDGLVVAFPISSEPSTRSAVTIAQDQTARIDGRTVSLKPAQGEQSLPRFIRSIEPPRIVTPRSLVFDFGHEVPGSLQDVQGRGIGLTHRLPGTGTALSVRDPNLRLDPPQRVLLLTTTRSDLNTQDRMPTGEYLGVRLSDLGFTGPEDFEISTTIPKIPGLDVVGQFGLYVATDSAASIRGGLLSQNQPDRYHLFLVKNFQGFDSDPNEIGLMTTGDDLRLTLRRYGGLYSLAVENLTRGSSNTLTITHPDFLDQRQNLYAGLFGANTQSDVSKTLNIKEVRITIWTAKPSG
jgi:FecR protein